MYAKNFKFCLQNKKNKKLDIIFWQLQKKKLISHQNILKILSKYFLYPYHSHSHIHIIALSCSMCKYNGFQCAGYCDRV